MNQTVMAVPNSNRYSNGWNKKIGGNLYLKCRQFHSATFFFYLGQKMPED